MSSGWNDDASTVPWRTRTGHAVEGGQDIDRVADRDHQRGPDEDGRQGRALAGPEGDVGLEGLLLASVAVATHDGIEQAEGALVRTPVEHLAGDQHEAGARPEEWKWTLRVTDPIRDRLEQTGGLEQHGQGRRLAARQHQAGEPLEIARPLDRPAGATHLGQRGQVLTHVPLQVEDPDDRSLRWCGGARYHPRSARCSPYCDASRPRIASPRPRDTLATCSASVK